MEFSFCSLDYTQTNIHKLMLEVQVTIFFGRIKDTAILVSRFLLLQKILIVLNILHIGY